MILDKNLRFADGVAVGAIGTRALGDAADLEISGRDIGVGQPVYARAQVKTGITAGATGTIKFQLVTADNAALSTNAVVLYETAVLDAAAGIAAGTVLFDIALPAQPANGYKQYLGVREVVAAANTTAGAVDAFLTYDQVEYRAYPQGHVQP